MKWKTFIIYCTSVAKQTCTKRRYGLKKNKIPSPQFNQKIRQDLHANKLKENKKKTKQQKIHETFALRMNKSNDGVME